jgi:hypothetical protein
VTVAWANEAKVTSFDSKEGTGALKVHQTSRVNGKLPGLNTFLDLIGHTF